MMLGLAQTIRQSTASLFTQSGYALGETAGNPLALRIGVIVNTVYMLVGIGFLMLTVYSGIQWMASGGNEEIVKKAMTRIRRAAIGLMIVVGAWSLTSFILRSAFGPPEPSGVFQVGDENAGVQLRIQQ